MPDRDTRLTAIFQAVFPGLPPAEVSHASRDSVENWDSIAAVTLASLLEEEFGASFDLEDAAEWTSYQQVRAALEKRLDG